MKLSHFIYTIKRISIDDNKFNEELKSFKLTLKEMAERVVLTSEGYLNIEYRNGIENKVKYIL